MVYLPAYTHDSSQHLCQGDNYSGKWDAAVKLNNYLNIEFSVFFILLSHEDSVLGSSVYSSVQDIITLGKR